MVDDEALTPFVKSDGRSSMNTYLGPFLRHGDAVRDMPLSGSTNMRSESMVVCQKGGFQPTVSLYFLPFGARGILRWVGEGVFVIGGGRGKDTVAAYGGDVSLAVAYQIVECVVEIGGSQARKARVIAEGLR